MNTTELDFLSCYFLISSYYFLNINLMVFDDGMKYDHNYNQQVALKNKTTTTTTTRDSVSFVHT